MASGKGRIHGDDKPMLRARADFLNRGFYDRLSRRVSEIVFENTPEDATVLDAGCGEGKYTADMAAYFEATGKSRHIVGIDISKDAINLASMRDKRLKLAVASAARIPLKSGSVDSIVSIFAPFFAEEFSRVLSPKGVVVRVYPLAKHLWELKELIYEVAYENPEPAMEETGFSICEKHELKYKMNLETNADIRSLFEMTPYSYRTGVRDAEKLQRVRSLECSAEFGVVVYKKV